MKYVEFMKKHIKESIDDADDITVEKVFRIIEDNDEGEDALKT